MIEYKIEDKESVYIEVSGHANYKKHGEDIVCAAVSTLSQCLLYFLKKRLLLEVYKIHEGLLMIKAKQCKEVQILKAFFQESMKEIENSYPNYVKEVK